MPARERECSRRAPFRPRLLRARARPAADGRSAESPAAPDRRPVRPMRARDQASQAAAAAVRAQKDIEAYLKIAAPFDGVVTDRFVHPGALVGPGADPVLLVIQQISH